MAPLLKRFAADQTGATSIEYALIAVLVGIAIIAAVTALGNSLKAIFTTVSSTVNTASS
jgi:pilus assembly protein Flp/PilA